jgi:hypothetical protein
LKGWSVVSVRTEHPSFFRKHSGPHALYFATTIVCGWVEWLLAPRYLDIESDVAPVVLRVLSL